MTRRILSHVFVCVDVASFSLSFVPAFTALERPCNWAINLQRNTIQLSRNSCANAEEEAIDIAVVLSTSDSRELVGSAVTPNDPSGLVASMRGYEHTHQ